MTPVSKEAGDSERHPDVDSERYRDVDSEHHSDVGSEHHPDAGFAGALSEHTHTVLKGR